jgi:hypothetical protein
MCVCAFGLKAQLLKQDISDYIHTFGQEAVKQMVEYKIPASVILAQAIFESNCGKSTLASRSNNHFGIKCHIEWGGDTIVKTDDTLNECFRKYNNVEDSYTDHSLFLKSRARYSHLFNLPITDYKAWCNGLKTAGYATYSAYAIELVKVIEEYNLNRFDLAEQVQITSVPVFFEEKIKANVFSLNYLELKDFIKSDVLFFEERDILIQSIDYLIKDKEIIEIAENYKYCKPILLDGAHNV